MRRDAIGWGLAAAALLGVAGDGSLARAGEEPAGRGTDLRQRVDAAVARGVSWLRSSVPAGSGEPGADDAFGAGPALEYHALRACGVPAGDPAAMAAWRAMRSRYDAMKASQKAGTGAELAASAYGVMCLAVADHGEPVAASDALGERTFRLSADDTAWMTEMARALEQAQDARGTWFACASQRDRGAPFEPSNVETQIALAGLKAASRSGVRVAPGTWLKSLRHFVETQAPGKKDQGRGWGWAAAATERDGGDPWVTAGAVSALALCRSELFGDPKYPQTLDAKAESAVRDGIVWLGERFGAVGFDVANVADAWAAGTDRLKYDEVWAVERAGGLARAARMGAHDWYAEGAEWVLAVQSQNGSWGVGPPEIADAEPMQAPEIRASTCLALLFLARGTLPVLTHPFDDSDVAVPAVEKLPATDLDDFVDVFLQRCRRMTDAGAKDRAFAKATAAGPGIVPPLVRCLASDTDDVRSSAFAWLRRATGADHGYDPSAKPAERAAAVARWQAWWTEGASTARYDPAASRIVVGPK